MRLEDAYSIIEIAKAAGYDTWWISNQLKYGAYDTPIAEWHRQSIMKYG